jgi:hypothetical protein
MRAKPSRACARLVALSVVVSACLLVPGAASPSSGASQPSGPSKGLTEYGREEWELDALLHDTFGNQVVDLAGSKTSGSNFMTGFVPIAAGGQYTYTFEDASHSTFKLLRPTRPPKTFSHGIYSPTQPFRVHGAYISCGHQSWLYRDPPGSDWIACLGPRNAASQPLERRQVAALPNGLTQYGRELWEFEALLHDSFGSRLVYSKTGPHQSINLTTTVTSSGTWPYTFADVSHSTFKLMRPKRQPWPDIGGNASSYPLTIGGAYISCGHGLWLYGPWGDPNINDFVWCEPLTPKPPLSPTTTGSNTLLRTRT